MKQSNSFAAFDGLKLMNGEILYEAKTKSLWHLLQSAPEILESSSPMQRLRVSFWTRFLYVKDHAIFKLIKGQNKEKDIKHFLISNHGSGDQKVAAFERHGLPTLILTSAYLPYDESDSPSSAVIELIN